MTRINILSLVVVLSAIYTIAANTPKAGFTDTTIKKPVTIQNTPTATPFPELVLEIPTKQKTLIGGSHVFQTFNNCGPSALSMTLSYYGIDVSQEVLGQDLRPYQIPQGDNDDKSVTLEELGEKAKDYGLIAYHRPNGTIETLKLFLTYDIPVITRTLTKETEDIGHFRVVKGYDDATGQIIQDDSLQGKNLRYSYDNYRNLWKAYNFEYLVLVPSDKKSIAEAILGGDKDITLSWKKAADNSRIAIINNPKDIYAGFNLSVALYNIGDYKGSIEEFEKIQSLLPFRTLWYQIEPILAYYELGNFEKVFEMTDKILNNNNRAFSELYLLRGKIYKKQGNINSARVEFEKAIYYNNNLKSANEALDNL